MTQPSTDTSAQSLTQALTESGSDLAAFNFFDPDYRTNPHPVLADLRLRDPIHRTIFGWIITRHADVQRLNRDPRLGRDLRKLTQGGRMLKAAKHLPGLGEMLATFMLHLDPPDHTRIRRLMAYAFTPKAIGQMEATVRQTAATVLDRMPERGDVGLIDAFAKPFPVTVICDLMQVPLSDSPMLAGWSEAIAEHIEVTATREQLAACNGAYFEIKDYLARFVEQRRKNPGDGLIDRLIAAEQETDALSSNELLANVILLILAGHETTTNLIGNGMLALIQHPDQLALLRQQPALVSTAVEECLRFESPANTNARCAHEVIEIGSKRIEPGDLVLCMLGAANRDPEVFADPDRFDITRDPNPHQSFGGGPHHCIGANLARLEGRVAIAGLLERYRSIELDGTPVQWRDRINLRGLSELNLRVTR